MKHNQLGNTDIHVSEIGFGCMSLGTDKTKAHALLHQALNAGITFFDTADLYDHGENERLLGDALKSQRDKIIIATKVGNRWNEDGKTWRWDASKTYIKQAVHASLKRLQTDYIDLYQLHGGTLEDPIDETIEAFEELKQAGVIRAYGISSIRPNVIRHWLKNANLSSVMMQYSLLDRRPEETMLDTLHQHNVSVIARGPVAKGLLADKPARDYLTHTQQDVTNAQTILKTTTTPIRNAVQSALRYVLAHPAVATTIPGASNAAQLAENTGAANAPELSHAELTTLKTRVRALVYEQHR